MRKCEYAKCEMRNGGIFTVEITPSPEKNDFNLQIKCGLNFQLNTPPFRISNGPRFEASWPTKID